MPPSPTVAWPRSQLATDCGITLLRPGTDYRFRIHADDGNSYHEVTQDQVDPSPPILFNPMGSPLPDPADIASDADYVDYITGLTGGFAIPDFIENRRKELQYSLLGVRLNRNT